MNRFFWRPLLASALLGFSVTLHAQTPMFTDLPKDSPILPAVLYLQEKGIVQAAPLFNPNGKLTRAQAAKIIVAPLVSSEELRKIVSSQFSDVPADQWYMPYAEAARSLGIVDSAPAFKPSANVTKAAFIKMLLSSKKISASSTYSEFMLPLSADIADAKAWFYPVMRYALSASLTAVGQDGMLTPNKEITRGEMALLTYRLAMYKEGRRTQALLSQTETEIANVLKMLDAKSIEQAEWASARSIITVRGALASRPTEPLVKGAVKIAEGFQSLVKGYKAGVTGDLDLVLVLAKEAYAYGDKAIAFAPGLQTIATQMQAIAKNMADQARETKASPAQ